MCYQEWCSSIGYATHCLFCCSMTLLVFYQECCSLKDFISIFMLKKISSKLAAISLHFQCVCEADFDKVLNE